MSVTQRKANAAPAQGKANAAPAPGKPQMAKFITPPTEWKRKVTKGSGPQVEAIQRRATDAMQQMIGDYLDHARVELAEIYEAIEGAKSASGEERDAALRKIRLTAHEIRNEAGSVGYNLLTRIGASLCEYVDDFTDLDPVKLKAISIHADAMRLVITEDMSGEGGDEGKELIAGISALVSKTLSA